MKTHKTLMVSLINGILACISIFFFSHLDLEYISTWGVSLLEHIHHGNITSYANDLLRMDYGTNYNLFQNLNVALWCLIPYVLSCVANISVPMVVYRTFIKVVIAGLHVLCARELYRVFVKLGIKEEKAYLSAILYFASPVVMIHGIGIGQIDCLGILFFLISIRFYLEKKYVYLAIFAGMALLSKVFLIMFYVPVLLLNFDKIKHALKYIGITVSVILVDKFFTNVFIKDYSGQATVHNQESFLPRLFHISINYESVVIMLVLVLCGICLMLGNRKQTKLYHWLLFPSLVFYIFFLFVFWHPQWMMYVLPILLLMGCYVENEWEYLLFYGGFSVGFTLHSMVNCNTSWFNAILMSESLFGQGVCQKNCYVGTWLTDTISTYLGNLGYTILMAAFALLILLYYISVSKRFTSERTIIAGELIWYMLAFIPTTIYVVLLFVKNIF